MGLLAGDTGGASAVGGVGIVGDGRDVVLDGALARDRRARHRCRHGISLIQCHRPGDNAYDPQKHPSAACPAPYEIGSRVESEVEL